MSVPIAGAWSRRGADAAVSAVREICDRLPAQREWVTHASSSVAMARGVGRDDVASRPEFGAPRASSFGVVSALRDDASEESHWAKAFESDGPRAAARLSAEFAVSIWDEHARRLHLVRDRIGMRSLYVRETADDLRWSSTASSLAGASPAPNLRAIARYLAISHTEHEETFFDGVRPVPPGHVLTWDGTRLDSCRYWHPERGRSVTGSGEELLRTYRDAFFRAVASRMPHGRVGVLLSGGLDSASIACAAARAASPAGPRPLALHLVATGLENDEQHHFDAVVRHAGLEAQTSDLDSIVPLFAPFPGPAFVDQLCDGTTGRWFIPLLRAARNQGVRRVFTGWGGDELGSWSCLSTRDLLARHRWREAWFSSSARASPRSASAWLESVRDAVVILGPTRAIEALRPAWRRMRRAPDDEPAWFTRQGLELSRAPRPPAPQFLDRGPAVQRLARQYFPPSTVEYNAAQFAMTELHEGIEIAHPFFDAELIETTLALADHEVVRGVEPKALPRAALRDVLPAKTASRRDFPSFDDVVRTRCFAPHKGALERLVDDSLLSDWGLVDRECLRRYVRAVPDIRNPACGQLIQFVAAEVWARTHFGGAR